MYWDSSEHSYQENYKLLTSVVVPRPIAWVSTVDTNGINNLAPFSFFTIATPMPPTVMFSSGHAVPTDPTTLKHTLLNVRATGEFVVNVVTEELLQPMNLTSADFPAGVDEFVQAGLTPVPSRLVRPVRVAESPVHLECRFVQELAMGVSTLVFGEVVAVHIDDQMFSGRHIDPHKLRPLGRLAGPQYCLVRELLNLQRHSEPPVVG